MRIADCELRICLSALLCAHGSGFLITAPLASAAPPRSQPASQPGASDGAKPFQPGVAINWASREVQVKATVILREGDIELFACSPKVREHEAIVRIEARPLHVYLAMGLIGLTPGAPAAYDPETHTAHTAHGDPVEVLVRYKREGGELTEPIEHWMRHARTDEALKPQDWIFAGSRMLTADESEEPTSPTAITADTEGTVVAIVDFPSSLIALPEQHSDNNQELWLRPYTDRIPPMNSTCELIIRPGPIRLRITPSGEIELGRKPLTLGQVRERLAGAFREWPAQRVRIQPSPDSPEVNTAELRRLLAELKIPEAQVTWEPAPPASGAAR